MKAKGIAILMALFLLPAVTMAEVHVYANDGDYIGIFLGMESNSTVIVYNPTMGLLLPIYTGHSIQASYEGKFRSESPYYTSEDCAGTPYLLGNGFYNSLVVTPDGNSFYHASGALSSLTMRSNLDGSGSCSNGEITKMGRVATEYTDPLPFTYPIPFPLSFVEKKSAVVIPLN